MDSDGDGASNGAEYLADTDPTNRASCFRVAAFTNGPPWRVCVPSSARRRYALQWAPDLFGDAWSDVPGETNLPGNDRLLPLDAPDGATARFYRVTVRMP